jgi:predicted transcriptional regulator of viral defense system
VAGMKYYERLVELQCFSRADVERLTKNKYAADSMIKEYKRKGYIESVRRNLFVAISMETKRAVANRFRIASSIMYDNYVSHHSALEYYGFANQVFYEVYVSGEGRFANFEYDDLTFHYVASRIKLGVFQNEDGVCVTDIERTVLDSINDFEKIGGLEELLRCFKLIPYVDEDKLLLYLDAYDKQVLYQKAGYILEHFQKHLRLTDNFFVVCESKRKGSVRYLYHGIEHEQRTFNSRWNIVVPQDLMKIISEGGSENAEL